MDGDSVSPIDTQWLLAQLRANKEVLVLLGLGVLMAMIGVHEWRSSQIASEVVEIIEATPDTQAVIGGVVIDVAGAVEKPGIYRLPNQARLAEVLQAAGGLSSQADEDWVARNLNLAGKLTDGMKVFIPKQGETSAQANSNSGTVAGTSVININTASQSDLDRLSGIGSARAQAIIQNRPYNAIEDLVTKGVLSQKLFDEIKGEISTY